MNSEVRVKIFRCNPLAKLPAYATAGSVGLDLQTMEDVSLHPGESVRLPTGIMLELPTGYEAQVRPRSSVSGKGVLVNLGTVDSDFRGQVLLNVTFIGNPEHRFEATVGSRLAQLVIMPVPRVVFDEVSMAEELGVTERGAAGFGSSGVR